MGEQLSPMAQVERNRFQQREVIERFLGVYKDLMDKLEALNKEYDQVRSQLSPLREEMAELRRLWESDEPIDAAQNIERRDQIAGKLRRLHAALESLGKKIDFAREQLSPIIDTALALPPSAIAEA
mgnify:CR=1 FL=1